MQVGGLAVVCVVCFTSSALIDLLTDIPVSCRLSLCVFRSSWLSMNDLIYIYASFKFLTSLTYDSFLIIGALREQME